MLTTVYFSADELAALLDGAFAYDGRGPVVELAFLDANGQPLPVARVAVWSEEKGLTVFARPAPEDANGPFGGETR